MSTILSWPKYTIGESQTIPHPSEMDSSNLYWPVKVWDVVRDRQPLNSQIGRPPNTCVQKLKLGDESATATSYRLSGEWSVGCILSVLPGRGRRYLRHIEERGRALCRPRRVSLQEEDGMEREGRGGECAGQGGGGYQNKLGERTHVK
jgi:hypothetical protein